MGCVFDIQKVPNIYKQNYIDLIQKINTLLNGDSLQNKEDKQFQITVLLPRYDIGFPYSMNLDDAAQLKAMLIDGFFLQSLLMGIISLQEISQNPICLDFGILIKLILN